MEYLYPFWAIPFNSSHHTDFRNSLFVCLFVFLFLSYSRPALAWEHAGDYLGMATTAILIFGLYNYLGRLTDILPESSQIHVRNRNRKPKQSRIVCIGGENECLALVLATHADRFLLTKDVCSGGNAVPNVPSPVMIPLVMACINASRMLA